MIKIDRLAKAFGPRRAVDDIAFTAARGEAPDRLPARERRRLSRHDGEGLSRFRRRAAPARRRGAQESRAARGRAVLSRLGAPPVDRHAVEGLSPPHLPRAGADPRSRRPRHGRADRRARPEPEARGEKPDPQARQEQGDRVLDPHPGGGRRRMHARDHHRPRPDRRQRHARRAARHVRAGRRRDAVGARRYRGKARRVGKSGAPGWSVPHLPARQGARGGARAGHRRAGQPGGLEGGGDVQRGGAARRGVPPHHPARHGEAMKPILTIARRELTSYFTSPVAYVFLVIFLLLTGFFTFTAGNFFERGEASLAAFFGWHPWLYLVLVPAVGMRVWAEERRSGTLELLLTMPITPWQAIVAKFLASWAFLAVALALTFPAVITANILGDPDNGPIVAGYLGSLLLAGAYLAIEEQAAEIACDDLAVVRVAEDVRGNDRGEGERQGDRQERPRSEELGDDRLPGRDRHGQQQLERAGAALLGPHPHADRGHENQVQPRVPAEERGQAGFSPFKEIAGGESEKAGEQQEDHQEHVGHRRGEIAGELAPGDGEDRLHRFTVSGRVMRRNTSSSCPASLNIPSTFQPSRLTSSTMPCASSAARALSRG